MRHESLRPRLETAQLLTQIAEKGGVIGVAAVANLISNKEVQTVFDVMDHVDYLVKLVGIDHVSIGTDAMFGDLSLIHISEPTRQRRKSRMPSSA